LIARCSNQNRAKHGNRLVGLVASAVWLSGYRKEWLQPDVMAALTAAMASSAKPEEGLATAWPQ
jgi:hypothetical protein